jgi:hypothetical protein
MRANPLLMPVDFLALLPSVAANAKMPTHSDAAEQN